MGSHAKRTGRTVKYVWSTILNDDEDADARATMKPGESVYAFVKIALHNEAARRRDARARGESDGNTNDKR